MKLHWIVGGVAVALCASVLLARQGVVVTQDDQHFEGDITERGGNYEVAQTDAKGARHTVTLNKGNVKDIIYADTVAAQVRKELATLDKHDVNSRIRLAQFAMQGGAYDVARDVLEEARQIEPDNRQVADLLNTVNAHIRMARGEKAAPATTRPTEAVGDGTAPTTRPTSSGKPIRMVTMEEVNRIRQIEWDRKEPIRVRIDADTRQRFIASQPDMRPAEFTRLSAPEQAALILDRKPDLADGVHILADPPVIAEYRSRIQRIVLTGCAANGCHGGNNAKGGSFYLFNPGESVPATYSNYLILQTYATTIDKVQHLMVDRQTPENSLLLQFMLPTNVAELPHPQAQNFRPVASTKSRPQYRQTYEWIRALPGVAPDYGIDLTQEAKKEPRTGR